MKPSFLMSAGALAACVALGAQAQSSDDPRIVVTGKRAHRVSSGATGLALDLKETPQSISVIDADTLNDFGVTGSNDALWLGTGVNLDAYETNRAVFTSRGFEIQSTQVDGLGISNSWGTVLGQFDAFLFDRIELIRGANGLLTGVGNAAGTINYVRKRPKNEDALTLQAGAGSYDAWRVAADLNKVLAEDGRWAGRLVVAHEDRDAHLRALHNRRSTLYGVVDGQVGRDGVLTVGLMHQDARQRSPMWGSLTLARADGSQATFDRSASTSQDWTYWNTRSTDLFAEYAHTLSADWEARITVSQRHADEDTRLLYAYSPTGVLQADGSGLIGWPYSGRTTTRFRILDAHLQGGFEAFGRRHELVAGLSHSKQRTATSLRDFDSRYLFQPLPAFPYAGDAYPEPDWQPLRPDSTGQQTLARLYAASRWTLAEGVKALLGVNSVRLQRSGSTVYGSTSGGSFDYPDTRQTSPYAGLTWDVTPQVTGYVSYSDIYQNQDQTDVNGRYLAPMKGLNTEAGLKADWLDRRLLTTLAVFSAEQRGLATYAGINASQQYYYEGRDVRSRGVEVEASGRLGADTRVALGAAHLKLTGPDGQPIYEWVPRSTVNAQVSTRLAALPALRFGLGARWQSAVRKDGGAHQGAYAVANGFAEWAFSDRTSLRLNVNNLLDRVYLATVQYGAIYGTPRNAALTLQVKL